MSSTAAERSRREERLSAKKRTNAANLSGTAIDGGMAQTINKGDFAIIPEGTPHQFKPVNGPQAVLMTLHVARPADSEMQ